jgi:hypothetical protein
VSTGEQKCPVCEMTLTETEHNAALVTLKKNNSKLVDNLLREERRKAKENHAKIKKENKARLEAMKRRQTVQNRVLQRRIKNAKLKYEKRMNHELVQMKRRYQLQAESIRDYYNSNQAKLGQTNQETPGGSDHGAVISQYEALASEIIARLDQIQDVLVDGSAGISSDSRFDNSSVFMSASKPTVTSSEDEKAKKLKEIADMIKQISAENKSGSDVYHNSGAP